MKVFLKKNIEKIGIAGEIMNVNDGFARNYLLPRDFAVEVTTGNEAFYKSKAKTVENRKAVVAAETSMLAEKIKDTKLSLKCKMHDDGKLYGAVTQSDIVDLLAQKGINVAKGQVLLDKSIKIKGTHEIVIRLSARLQPVVRLSITSE
ncbi:MAG: 50S ribosomal protein L9 [Candidatus Dependentiae bacterium]|nr:50S ribosomal protein L9 [Candidatus Dependentiae bacterium]